jgi:UPF0755 protein
LTRRALLRFITVLAVASTVIGGSVMWLDRQARGPGPAASQTTVIIPKGTTSAGIAQSLVQSSVIDSEWLFLGTVRLTGRQGLKAGEYSFPAHISLTSVIDMMHRGQVVVHKFTVAEGLTSQQVVAQLRQTEGLVGKIDTPPEEGTLLPETYFFAYGDSRDSLVARMTQAMTAALDEQWARRPPGLLLASKTELLTLASIVERETAIAEERPHIASVFYNRLRQHMRLQSDPTAIYAVSNGEGVLERPLSRDDLAVKSPYNTYMVDGLPAGPICNPGRASLQAVLHPVESEDLYFVADGSGGHVFARNLNDHNRNVTRLRHLEAPAAVDKRAKPAR